MAESRVELTFSDPGAGAASRRQLMLLVGAGAAATLLCTALVLLFCFCRCQDKYLKQFFGSLGNIRHTPGGVVQTTLFAFHICQFVSPKKGKRCHLGAINTVAPGSSAHPTRILSKKISLLKIRTYRKSQTD